MRGFRLQLTRQQAKDLKFILTYEVSVPKAISARLKKRSGESIPEDEQVRLGESMRNISANLVDIVD